VDKPCRPNRPYVSPGVNALIRAAGEGDRLRVLLRYRAGIKPTEAEAAYRAAVAGLTVKPGYPPTVTVEGDKDSVQQALGHELTVAAVRDFQEYSRDLLPTRPASPHGRG
jgi:hypothetical protein